MQPAIINVNAIGQLEGYTHQASLIYLDEEADIKTLSAAVSMNVIIEQKEISFGITAAPVNGLIVRLLGHKAEQLHRLFKINCRLLATNLTI